MATIEAAEPRTRILFVDDESNVLNGLRRMLRPMRKEWEMAFAETAQEALDAFDKQPFEIVVSDLRMPGMDGATLLGEIRERAPETVRIALSGYADKASTLRAVLQAHQFIAKPCDCDVLRGVVARAVELGELLTDDKVKRVVAGMGSIPSLPALYREVEAELEKPSSSLKDVGQVIGRDAGMSAKVLQLANSCFFGFAQQITSPEQATVLLGIDTMRTLVLSVRIFEQLEEMDSGPVDVETLWNHSVAVARLARRIALAECAEEHAAECAFLAGLLHDLGKVIYAVNMNGQYSSALKLGGGHPKRTARVESKALGATHGELAAYLMGLWGFPATVIQAIRFHNDPKNRLDGNFTPLDAVYIANTLLHRQRDGEPDGYALTQTYLREINRAKRAPIWEDMCRDALTEERKQRRG